MRQSERSKRLAGVLELQIPGLIQKFFTPDQIGFVTVSAIEVCGDLKVVDVFVRTINGPDNFCKKLNRSGKRFSYALTKLIDIRQSLVIRFKEDQSVNVVEAVDRNFKN